MRFTSALLGLLLAAASARAATIVPLNLGAAANDRTGHSLRVGGGIINSNFVAVNNALSNLLAVTGLSATNLATTNGTSFGLFWQNNGGVLEFFNLKQGTNAVLYSDGSNIVVNGQPGGGEVTTEQLNNASNAVWAAKQPLDAGLTSIAGLTILGVPFLTAADTYTIRALVGVGDGIDISNGAGELGNPTFAIVTNLVTSLTEDQTPATNDPIFAVDASAAAKRKVVFGNFPVSGPQRLAINSASNDLWAAETTRNAAVSNALVTLSSNSVRVVAGTGGITVTPSGAGGVMTYTVNDDDAGGGTGSMTTLRTNAAVAGTNLVALLLTNANVASPVRFNVSSNGGVAIISAEVANLSGSGNVAASNAPTFFSATLLGATIGGTANFTALSGGDITGTSLLVEGAATVEGALKADTSVITPRLQVGSISNITHQVGDNWHLNGASNWYSSEITSNTTAVLTNLFLNTPLFLTVSNRGSFTLDFNVPAVAWRELNGQAPVLAPNGITKFMFVKEAVGQTNAYILSEPSLDLAPGWGQALVTNGNTVSVTMTNRSVGIATNVTSATIGFSDAENIQIYNVGWMLVTNLTLSPTNLVVGRTIAVYLPTNSITYDVTITNTAANRVNWNFNVATNGSTSFTKTNTLFARLYLTAETNGVLSAEMGYYR